TRSPKESELFFSRWTSHFRTTESEIPRHSIQSLFTRRPLDVLHELAGTIEDLQLERCFFVELVFEVVSYQRAGRRVWTSKLFVADPITSETARVSQRGSHGKQ